MRRQATTLLVAGVLAVVVALVGVRLPAPYVRLVPGPVSNTLGEVNGHPLITIKGHPTFSADGRIYLVTVGEYGGPGKNLSAADVLSGWWNKSDSVVPLRVLYPPTVTAKQAAQQDAADMTQSQEEAKVAALRYLGYDLQPGVDVASISSTSTAKGTLHVDDVIVGVDGTTVTDSDGLLKETSAHDVGDKITLNVNRNGKKLDVPVTLEAPVPGGSGAPSIGITVVNSFAKPFEIDIDLKNVGGPSAGMAFALGIIDKLTKGGLTGGRTIAGTGTIDDKGNVGAIGGVQQKMAGARHAGATVFLVPAPNCAEALKAVPHGLRLVKVSTLSGAVAAIKAIRDGGSHVPSC